MHTKTIINSIGLALTILGVYIAFKNSPINEDTIDGGSASTDFSEIRKKTLKMNRRMKIGIYLVIVGTTLQLISNFIRPQC